MSPRLTIVLIASLVLNVFLIGLGIGLVVTGARITPAAGPGARRPIPAIWQAASALPTEERAKFRQMLRDKATAVQPELKTVRLARREAAALMSQPSYDGKAVADALRRAREGEMRARGEIDQAFADYLGHLPTDQRAAVAESMVRNRPGALQRMNGEGGGEQAAP